MTQGASLRANENTALAFFSLSPSHLFSITLASTLKNVAPPCTHAHKHHIFASLDESTMLHVRRYTGSSSRGVTTTDAEQQQRLTHVNSDNELQ
jgi:hypothetical protein